MNPEVPVLALRAMARRCSTARRRAIEKRCL